MPGGARRLLSRPWRRCARRALLAVCLWQSPAAADESILEARYAEPTTRYAHGVLGDAVEHISLVLTLTDGSERTMRLPDDLVFEDTAPRVGDLDGDGRPEVVVVEASQQSGARLAIWGPEGRITATPFIGTRFRWLAPVGAADLDGDGITELAYVDRPHLAKTLRIWRYEKGTMEEVAALPGVTNHRIGEPDIAGGIRTCGSAPEMLVATADWSNLLAVRYKGGDFGVTPIGNDTSRPAFARALRCAF